MSMLTTSQLHWQQCRLRGRFLQRWRLNRRCRAYFIREADYDYDTHHAVHLGKREADNNERSDDCEDNHNVRKWLLCYKVCAVWRGWLHGPNVLRLGQQVHLFEPVVLAVFVILLQARLCRDTRPSMICSQLMYDTG
jgi:hypothetical protein